MRAAEDTTKFKDHPRIRGEHRLFTEYERRGGGSSPHTRGARPQMFVDTIRGRIIPAYAGSTGDGVLRFFDAEDHPRIRGEHPHRLLLCERGEGSSPHTRGALGDLLIDLLDDRIIPAYAGSTSTPVLPTASPRDHPRIRGEHLPQSAMTTYLTGSSPHTRGARRSCSFATRGSGIIPAYAGSTFCVA